MYSFSQSRKTLDWQWKKSILPLSSFGFWLSFFLSHLHQSPDPSIPLLSAPLLPMIVSSFGLIPFEGSSESPSCFPREEVATWATEGRYSWWWWIFVDEVQLSEIPENPFSDLEKRLCFRHTIILALLRRDSREWDERRVCKCRIPQEHERTLSVLYWLVYGKDLGAVGVIVSSLFAHLQS